MVKRNRIVIFVALTNRRLILCQMGQGRWRGIFVDPQAFATACCIAAMLPIGRINCPGSFWDGASPPGCQIVFHAGRLKSLVASVP